MKKSLLLMSLMLLLLVACDAGTTPVDETTTDTTNAEPADTTANDDAGESFTYETFGRTFTFDEVSGWGSLMGMGLASSRATLSPASASNIPDDSTAEATVDGLSSNGIDALTAREVNGRSYYVSLNDTFGRVFMVYEDSEIFQFSFTYIGSDPEAGEVQTELDEALEFLSMMREE